MVRVVPLVGCVVPHHLLVLVHVLHDALGLEHLRGSSRWAAPTTARACGISAARTSWAAHTAHVAQRWAGCPSL